MLKSGALGEIAVMKHFLSDGYEVYSSVSDNSTYDMVVARDGTLLKVEVKSTSNRIMDGKYEVQLKSVRSNKTRNVIKNFDNTRVDLLVVYVEPEDKVLVFNSKELTCKTSMRVSVL